MQTGSHWNQQTSLAIGTAIVGPIRRAMHRWTSKALASPTHHHLDWWSFSQENERADVERPVDEANRGNLPLDVLEGRTQRYTSSPDRRIPPSPAHGASHTRPNPEDPPQTAGGRYCAESGAASPLALSSTLMAGHPGTSLALGCRTEVGNLDGPWLAWLPPGGHLSQ